MTKPFGPGELVARVQAALRRAGPRRGRAADRGRRPRRSTSPRTPSGCDGEEVHLTPIEFSLLRVLALNRGLLMTHRQLLIEVWGPEYADATPLLRTHIANLRGKLGGSAPRRSFIRTDAGHRLPLQRLSSARPAHL